MSSQEGADLVSFLDELGHEIGIGFIEDLDGYDSSLRIPRPVYLRHAPAPDQAFQIIAAEAFADDVDRRLWRGGLRLGLWGYSVVRAVGKLRVPDLDPVARGQNVAECSLFVDPGPI